MELKDIDKLAVLGRLDIPQEEKETVLRDLTAIVGYIDQIQSVPVDLSVSVELPEPRNVFREDTNPKNADWSVLATSIVGEGSRNWTHTKLIGKMLHDLSPELWETCGWPAIRAWNAAHAEPPTPEKELRATWESLKEKQSLKPENKEERENVSDKILRIILTDPSVELFHDQYNDSYKIGRAHV